MDVWTQVEELIRDAVESQGFELVHAEQRGKGGAAMLRVYIDKPGGVNLSDCQRVSRHLGVLLDVEDLIPHRYTLEVSSPGVERPLFRGQDYERFAGQEVRVTTGDSVNGRKRFTGVLQGIAGDVVRIECGGEIVEIGLDNIKKANLVYRFD